MKITCDKQTLWTAISKVVLAVSAKSTIQSLEGILLKAKGDMLHLTGYDLEFGISTKIEARIIEEGSVVLSAKIFADIVRRLPSEDLTLSCDDKLLCEINSGLASYTILGISADDFPELPSLSGTSNFSISQNKLASMINQTLFAIAVSDSKPVHTGSLFDVEGDTLTIVSVDGYRLALRREKVSATEDMSFIVPGKALSDILRLLVDSDDEVNIEVSKKHILFNISDCIVISRLLEGDFLNYKTAIPNQKSTTVTIKTREFMESIERTGLLISDRLRSPLKVEFEKNQIQISCSTTIGKANDQLDCVIEGEPVEMGFNNRYLLDALKATGCDQVQLGIGGALAPMTITPMQSEEFLFLVLPIRLKNE